MSLDLLSSSCSNSNWTIEQNKLFEIALAIYGQDTPDCWMKIANAIGGKTVEEIKMQYQKLIHDIQLIEAGKVPLPDQWLNA